MGRLQHRRVLVVSLCVCAGIAWLADPPSASGARSQRSADGAYPVTSVDVMPPLIRAAYIVAIRKELAAHGYAPAAPLSSAIRAYQRDARLPVDGIASKELLDHLMFAWPRVEAARRAPAAPMDLAPRPPAGTLDDAVPARPRPRPQANTAPPSPPVPPLPKVPREPVTSEKLVPPGDESMTRPGAPADPRGGVVSHVQRELQARGYYDGRVDGTFGPEVSEAVGRFQEDHGLAVTGVLDAGLLNALAPLTTTRR